MLSILSGKFKGQKLQVPPSTTRPTSSLVKKALFDSIRSSIEDCIFCDLFAGSGAVALEALSQGAASTWLIEANKQALSCIKANVAKLQCQDSCEIHLSKASVFLSKHSSHLVDIDIFFIDPPYEIKSHDGCSYESILKILSQASLKESCLIVCETKDPLRIEKPLESLEALDLVSKKKYGDSFLYFIRKH